MPYFKTGSAEHGSAYGLSYPRPHHGMVSEYQQSSIPFLTSSAYISSGNPRITGISTTTPVEVAFPFVTRWLEVKNVGHGDSVLKVGFSSNGIAKTAARHGHGQNCFILSGSEATGRLEIKCKALYFLQDGAASPAQFQVIAGLTNIHRDDFPILTGSNGVEGVG